MHNKKKYLSRKKIFQKNINLSKKSFKEISLKRIKRDCTTIKFIASIQGLFISSTLGYWVATYATYLQPKWHHFYMYNLFINIPYNQNDIISIQPKLLQSYHSIKPKLLHSHHSIKPKSHRFLTTTDHYIHIISIQPKSHHSTQPKSHHFHTWYLQTFHTYTQLTVHIFTTNVQQGTIKNNIQNY